MIELKNIQVIFNPNTQDERHALNNISLTIQDGEFISVIGSNGAGKSTLLNVLAASIPISSGKVLINGKDCSFEKEYQRAQITGRVFQNPLAGTAAEMMIMDNLAVATRKGRKRFAITLNQQRKKEFRQYLSQLDLGLENRMTENVSRLSGGQRQALTLLMATISKPKILLLDEHTAALDPSNAEKIMNLTKRFADEYGLSVLMVTHDMSQAISTGTRLIMMDQGEIIMDLNKQEKSTLTMEDLIERFRQLRKRELAGDRQLLV